MSNFRAGVLALAIIAAGVWFAFGGGIPGRSSYEIEAVFGTVNNLKPGSPVRIAGVPIGKVAAVEHITVGEPAAIVRMRIESKGLPIRRNARVSIRARMFLEGNFFVDVQPGTSAEPELADGDRIPISQTSSPVQVNYVLTALQADTREQLQGLLGEFGRAARDSGKAFNRSIEHWSPAYRGTAQAAEALLGQTADDLRATLSASARWAEALDRDPEALRSLLRDLDTTAGAFAVQEARLRETVAELPGTLAVAQSALGELNAAFPAIRRLAADARPAVRAAAPAVRAGVPLVRQLRGLVSAAEGRGLARDLRAATPYLARAAARTPAVLDQGGPLASCAAENLLPWSKETVDDPDFPATGPIYQELPKSFGGVAGESRSGDANGQWVRVIFNAGLWAYPTGDDNFLLAQRPIQGANPPKPDRMPPLRPDVACETQQRPDLSTRAAPPPPGFKVDVASTAAKRVETLGRRASDRFVAKLLKRSRLDIELGDRALTRADLPLLSQTGPVSRKAR